MATLIVGAGGHADDIAMTTPGLYAYPHHTDVPPLGYADEIIIGINDPSLREKVAAELGVRDLAWIHPDAKLYVDVTYGHGTHINYGVTMTRTRVGRHTTIAPGVTICGDVVIGDRCMIGAGAVITNLLTIGDDAIIGAGAVILSDVPAGETWVGNPARRIR